MKKFTLAVMTVAGLVGTQAAFAGDSGWYLLGAFGQNYDSNDKGNADNIVTSLGYSGFASHINRPAVYNLDIGYQLNKYLAFEGGYFGTNNEIYTVSGGNLTAPYTASANAYAWNVKVVGMMPITDQFSLLGKIGVANSTVSQSLTYQAPLTTTLIAPSSESIMGVTYGIGAKYDFTENISGRLDLDRYKVGSSFFSENLSAWTVGIAYKF